MTSSNKSVNSFGLETIDSAPVDLIRFPGLGSLRHGVSTRIGGVSAKPFESLNVGYSTSDAEDNVTENRRRFLRALSADPAGVMVAHLTHGTDVAVFKVGQEHSWARSRTAVRPGSDMKSWGFEADGVVSNAAGYTFLITAADCTPLLFWDPFKGVVGAAHAGWRGTARGIALGVVRKMIDVFGSDPTDVRAAIGPSIGPCCYVVQPDVIAVFEESHLDPVLVHDGETTRLDLWETNRQQLLSAGLRDGSVECSALCTACNVSLFYSHRAEHGRTGRMAAAIGL